jgi:electron transport complex protein RnfA
MSYLVIVLTSVFSANALLVYGFGLCPAFRRKGQGSASRLLALFGVNLLASGLSWLIRHFVLAPFGLEVLDVVLYAVLVVPLIKYLSRAIASLGNSSLSKVGAAADEMVTSCLVFGIALIASRGDYNMVEAIVASLGACLGYWLALVILDSIRERLELSDLPPSFRGAPAMLVSAGLMAMAFLGLDEVLIRTLAR